MLQKNWTFCITHDMLKYWFISASCLAMWDLFLQIDEMEIIVSLYFVVIHHCVLFKNVNPGWVLILYCSFAGHTELSKSQFLSSALQRKQKNPLCLSKNKNKLFLYEKRLHLTSVSVTDIPYRILYHMTYHIHIRCNSLAHSLSHNRIQ